MSFDLLNIQTRVEAAAVDVAVVVPVVAAAPDGKVPCKHCRKPLTRKYMSKHLTKCKSRPQPL
jgi:hypothetical protein